MNYSYKISGCINAYPIKDKYFKDLKKAFKYIDKITSENNLQVEDVYETGNVITTYKVNNYSRIFMTKLA